MYNHYSMDNTIFMYSRMYGGKYLYNVYLCIKHHAFRQTVSVVCAVLSVRQYITVLYV